MRSTVAPQSWSILAADVIRQASNRLRALVRVRPAQPVVAPLPARHTAIEQWARVAGVLSEAQSRAHRVLDSHKGASAQLDAATYALQRLREEMIPAFHFTITQPVPPPLVPSAFRREQFRRREPLAA